MEKIAIEDVEVRNNPLGVHGEGRPVSGALGTEHVAMNFFRLQPGESFSGGLHTRHDQEELFSVESGTATFEVGWALGAPGARHDWDGIESVVPCWECGEETGHGLELTDEGSFKLTCRRCGNSVVA